MMNKTFCWLCLAAATAFAVAMAADSNAAKESDFDPVRENVERIAAMKVQPGDWPQWAGTSLRNNVVVAERIPTEWDLDEGANVKWAATLGSQTYGNPVVANGKVYVGTNNGAGYIERYPDDVDLGCLLAFDEKTGEFLWQHSSEKLKTGRVHDWPLQGICCAPYAEGDRLWYVTNRGEICCLDSEGFLDGENDGPYQEEEFTTKNEADVIWKLDMMEKLGISQHNMCSCSITCAGDLMFVNTSNGVDESHLNIPSPDAPSFLCMNRNTGEIYWHDKSPGVNILHGQWSSPSVAVLGGVPQVLFAGGDGWLYSFKAEATAEPELLWKFDCNPKDSKWELGGRGTRNNVIGTPVVYDGMVYIAVGQDPEHGEGIGHMWCIDPTKRGDVSPEVVFDKDGKPVPHRRLQAAIAAEGDVIKPNPNTAMVWHYTAGDHNDDGTVDFEEEMHRTIGTVAIKNDLLFIADFSGLVHCVDAKTGKPHWTYDMLAASWGSALICNDYVYIGDEDGDVTIFKLSPKMEVVAEHNMGNSVYTTPVVANNVLYISSRTHLYALQVQE